MTSIGQTARSRSGKIRAELAKRGQVETRVEHTEKLDLAEGDRERIAALEREVAELSNRLETLTQDSSADANNATVPLVPSDDGDLRARVAQLEEAFSAYPEMQEVLASLADLMHTLSEKQRQHADKMAGLHGQVGNLRAGVVQALAHLDETVATVQQISGGR